MTNFHEVTFPLAISLNTEGGPTRRTDVVSLVSGHEERNSPWAGSRRSYNAGYGVKSLKDIDAVLAFFEARRGKLYGFRFRDPFDHRSGGYGAPPDPLDQRIGTGDGAATQFQLQKRYESGGYDYTRPIVKPVAGTVVCAVDGVQTTAFALDAATGQVTFDAAPGNGAAVSAGFLFDTPVRFDTDSLRINLAAFEAGDIPSIALIEVLL